MSDLILDESGESILDELGAGIEDGSNADSGNHHRDVLAALTPVKLGPNAAAEMAVDGNHLDLVQGGANDLLNEMFPDTCAELIDDWERLLGLPDSCTGELPTLPQRVSAVAAKWAEKRKISAAYLVEMAEAMGFTVTITNYARRRYGQALYGGNYCGREWAGTITVNAPGMGTADRQRLECALLRLRPAHVYVDFNYT